MQHPDEGTIHAWLDGALSADERAEVERHVATCADCSAMVAEARGLIAGASRIVGALDAIPGGVIPQPATVPAPAQSTSVWRALRITPARAAIAASMLLAASAVIAKRHDTPDKMVPHAPVVAVAEPAINPVSDTAAPAKPAPNARSESAPAARGIPASISAPNVVAAAPVAPAASAAVPVAAPVAQLAVAADTARREAVSGASPMAAKMGEVADATSQSKARAGFAPSRAFGLAANASQGGLTAFVGCYEVKADSAHAAEFIPTRFALQLAPRDEPSAQRVVRAVASDGRVDSILAGSTWRVTTPMTVNVSFTSPSGPQHLSLITASNGSLGAFVVTEAERRSVPITRSTCVTP